MNARLRDPGAQPERTALAWQRTTLALTVVGLLCVRPAPSMVSAGLAAAAVCGAVSLQIRRTLKRHPRHTDRHLADPLSALLATAVTLLMAVIAIVFALEN
jgi:uncharacterized membrane protein YidH (DUF202 family)